MNKIICIVLSAVAVAFSAERFLQLTVSANYPAIESKAGVWLSPGSKGPVTVWFHGGMASGNCEKGLVAGRDISEMVPEYTTVSVSACKNNHWVTRTAIQWVDAALDSIAVRRGTPVDSVNLIGISDGSLGVVSYAFWGKRSQVSRVLMSSYGPALGSPAEVALQLSSRKGRWRFIQGGADRLYPSSETLPWITDFCKNVGTECDLKFDPVGEHDWSFWQKHQKNWILEFFYAKPLTKKR